MPATDSSYQYLHAHFVALKTLLGLHSSSSRTEGTTAAEYQPILSDAVASESEPPEAETVILRTPGEPDVEMGFDDRFEKSEGRGGDAIAQIIAIVSAATFFIVTWVMTLTSTANFKWFGWHPLLQTLGLVLITYGILTLQPTSQARTKAAGLARHQIVIAALGIPIIILGYTSIFVTKNMANRSHFTTWHGLFGLWTLCIMGLQLALGGGSVWFNGFVFGGNPRAKAVWKYHRVVGYVTFLMLLTTMHLGGTWSTWSYDNSSLLARLFAFTFAPIGLIVGVYSRIRLSKMQFF